MSFLQQFNYRILGQKGGPKLVFLHGVMGNLGNWRRITPSFENRFEVLTFDQRGHGRSFKPENGYAPEDYATDLLKILDELGWQKVFLVGHSMGGRSAQNFAVRFSQRVERLVIEDIGPDKSEEAVRKMIDMIERTPTPFRNKKTAKEYFYNEFKDVNLGAYLYSNIEDKEDGSADWRFSKKGVIESIIEGRAKERWDEIKKLTIPTLLIRGTLSDELSHEVFEKVLEMNANIQGVEIEGAGHWVHFDKPNEFISAIQKFLEGESFRVSL